MRVSNRISHQWVLGTVLICTTVLPTAALTTDEIREEFVAAPGGTLVVEVGDGHVEIVPHDEDRVVVEVYRRVRAATEQLEQEALAEYEVKMAQRGDEVRIEGRTRRQDDWIETREFSVRFVITAPRRFSADLRTADGDISAHGLEGRFQARTSDGNLRLRDLRGKMTVRTSDGEVEALSCAGSLELQTSDGSVHIDNFAGPVSARTSDGDITASLHPPEQASDFQSADGSISLRVDPASALTFDCQVADGEISSQLPIQGSRTRRRLQGDLNGGGPVLLARVADGDITVSAR